MSLLTLSIPFGLIGADALARELGAEAARGEVRRFPDGEWYVRIDSPVVGRDVAVVCPLDQPDEKFLAASLAAGTARDLGASRVGIVAPYLAYMRQDCRFRRGEGVTSAYFARLISSTFDWLVTVDPHLHRRASLGEIYSIPTRVAHAAPLLAAWINGNVEKPLLVGPDGESEQWVSAVAEGAGAPYVVLEKTRRGDRDVEIALPSVGRYAGRTPVLVDDIVSTATTMIETVRRLRGVGMPAAVCVGVHGVFTGGAYDELVGAGAARVVTTNTVPHASNGIDVLPLVARELRALVSTDSGDHVPA
ncbi:MAG: ribose-phosphate pyrophosphokinase [Actinomycetota bacterium]|jgi:ribose-phosphate pyrophosphokinase|nr:ribose-phosphate pyrophosphokinase [Actinomycetota bacterium]